MRYAEDHKAQTHQRILAEAAARFRRDGIGATGLQPLMNALGLTHGGFYAHFKSKDDLVEKALACAAGQSRENARQAMADNRSLTDVLEHYLSREHRDSPEKGCPLPTMAAELGQRHQPSPITDELITSLHQLLAGTLAGIDREAQAITVVSAMVGALMLSRSTHDPQLSARILDTTREQLKKLADGH